MSLKNDILDARELAEALGITYQTTLKLAKQGEIPHFKVGTFVRFNRQVIEDWMFGQDVEQVKPAGKPKPRPIPPGGKPKPPVKAS